jgi:hypothetical protein
MSPRGKRRTLEGAVLKQPKFTRVEEVALRCICPAESNCSNAFFAVVSGRSEMLALSQAPLPSWRLFPSAACAVGEPLSLLPVRSRHSQAASLACTDSTVLELSFD